MCGDSRPRLSGGAAALALCWQRPDTPGPPDSRGRLSPHGFRLWLSCWSLRLGRKDRSSLRMSRCSSSLESRWPGHGEAWRAGGRVTHLSLSYCQNNYHSQDNKHYGFSKHVSHVVIFHPATCFGFRSHDLRHGEPRFWKFTLQSRSSFRQHRKLLSPSPDPQGHGVRCFRGYARAKPGGRFSWPDCPMVKFASRRLRVPILV